MRWVNASNQRGDTLIEVVMSMAILTVTLVSAYNVASMSFRVGMQARERTEATHLVQQQIERLMLLRDKLITDQLATPNPDNAIFISANFPTTAYRLQYDLSRQDCSAVACIEGLYQVQMTSVRDSTRLAGDHLITNVVVSWRSAVNNQNQSITVEMPLADMRGMGLRNCEVATDPACID
jgi:Tfp pilus assembly protein PilV